MTLALSSPKRSVILKGWIVTCNAGVSATLSFSLMHFTVDFDSFLSFVDYHYVPQLLYAPFRGEEKLVLCPNHLRQEPLTVKTFSFNLVAVRTPKIHKTLVS